MDEATRVLRWDDLAVTPWKNGGGGTRSLAAAPEGAATTADFDWRVSVADVASDGPFSAFPGVARVLMLVDGAEMILTVDGATHRLGPGESLAFSGAADTSCRVPSGPTRDLNLMTRNGRADGSLQAVTVAGEYETALGKGESVVLVALTPGLSLEHAGGPGTGTTLPPGLALGALDSVLRQAPGFVRVSGSGTLAQIRVRTAG
jgi:uncharacterized protein